MASNLGPGMQISCNEI